MIPKYALDLLAKHFNAHELAAIEAHWFDFIETQSFRFGSASEADMVNMASTVLRLAPIEVSAGAVAEFEPKPWRIAAPADKIEATAAPAFDMDAAHSATATDARQAFGHARAMMANPDATEEQRANAVSEALTYAEILADFAGAPEAEDYTLMQAIRNLQPATADHWESLLDEELRDLEADSNVGESCVALINQAQNLLGQMADITYDEADAIRAAVAHQCRVFYFG